MFANKLAISTWKLRGKQCKLSVFIVCFWTYSMLAPQGDLSEHDKEHDITTCDKFGFEYVPPCGSSMWLWSKTVLRLHASPLGSRYHDCVVGSTMTATSPPWRLLYARPWPCLCLVALVYNGTGTCCASGRVSFLTSCFHLYGRPSSAALAATLDLHVYCVSLR